MTSEMEGSSSSTPMYPATSFSEDNSSSGEYLLLFKLSQENVGNTPFFPYELVSEFFPPPPGGRSKVVLVGLDDEIWETYLVYSTTESSFMITKGWAEYATHCGLLDGEIIQFYEPEPRLHNWHFLVDNMSPEEANDVNDDDKNESNFLFQVQLTEREISSNWITIPDDVVISHFPGVNIPEQRDIILHFLDVENRDWEIKCQFDALRDGYLIKDGWDAFVLANNVIPTMELIFSVPVHGHVANQFVVWGERGGEGNGGGGGYVGDCKSEVGSGEEGDGEGSGQGSC